MAIIHIFVVDMTVESMIFDKSAQANKNGSLQSKIHQQLHIDFW